LNELNEKNIPEKDEMILKCLFLRLQFYSPWDFSGLKQIKVQEFSQISNRNLGKVSS